MQILNGYTQAAHPVRWTNPVVLRASAALPAAGAFDAAPTASFSTGAESLTLSFTYTRGAAGGGFDWQIEVSLYSVAANAPTGAAEWVTEPLYAAGAVAEGADSQSRVQREYQTYGSQGAAAEDFIFGPIELGTAVERVRVRARESADGVVGSPGTLSIVGVLR